MNQTSQDQADQTITVTAQTPSDLHVPEPDEEARQNQTNGDALNRHASVRLLNLMKRDTTQIHFIRLHRINRREKGEFPPQPRIETPSPEKPELEFDQ